MNNLEKQLVNSDFVEWDAENWSKAIVYWEKFVDIQKKQKLNCLELGARHGGLSLWLALKGHNVICSDLHSPEQHSSKLHNKFSIPGEIKYQAIDATNIPYENFFDLVVFKSILGGIGKSGQFHLMQKVIDETFKSLKPGGKVLFAENLRASWVHQFFRKKLTRWGWYWSYLDLNQIEVLFKKFKPVDYDTAGFFGTFGRNESQKKFLGKIDTFLMERLVSKEMMYIVFGVATKPMS